MEKISTIVLAAATFTLVAGASAYQGASDRSFGVSVNYSDSLQGVIEKVNDVEQEREMYFREYRDDQRHPVRTVRRFARIHFPNVKWAGETMVPDLENYTVDALLGAMIAENLKNAAPANYNNSVRVTIKRLKVANHSVARLRSSHSYAVGTVDEVSPAGQVVRSFKVSANLSPNFTNDPNYDGPDFAFEDTDEVNRVGPVLAQFAEDCVEKLFPGEKVAGPILVGRHFYR